MQIEFNILQPDRVLLSVESQLAHLAGTEAALMEAAMVVYEATGLWFDSEGEGTWPKLAQSTVDKKAAQGLAAPERILYAEGNLRESVTSPTGPYSYFIPMFDGIVFGAVWTPIRALSTGSTGSGRGHATKIPARPIFPPADSATGLALMREIGYIIMHGTRSPGGLDIGAPGHAGGSFLEPAFPGAVVGRSTLGTFLPLGPH